MTNNRGQATNNEAQITRNELVNRMFRAVTNSKYYSLMGPRGRGTSTMLKQLYKNINQEPESDYYLPVFIDLSLMGEVGIRLAHVVDVHNEIVRHSGVGEELTEEIDAEKFSGYLEKIIGQCSKQLILIIDHIDAVPNDVARELLFGLRPLYGNKLGVAIAGGTDLMRLTTGELSPFNVAEEHFLEPLILGEAQSLINDVAAENDMYFTKGEMEGILSLVRGEACLIKHLIRNQKAFELLEFSEDSLSIFTGSLPDMVKRWSEDRILGDVIKGIESNWNWLKIVSDLLDDNPVSIFDGTKGEFQSPDMCLALERADDGYTFANPFFEILLKEHFTPRRLADAMVMNNHWEEAKAWYEKIEEAKQPLQKLFAHPDDYTMDELVFNACRSVGPLARLEDVQREIVDITYHILGVNCVGLLKPSEDQQTPWIPVERRVSSENICFCCKDCFRTINIASSLRKQATAEDMKVVVTPVSQRGDLQCLLCSRSRLPQNSIQRKAQETLMQFYGNVVLELEKISEVEKQVEQQRRQLQLVSTINATILQSLDVRQTSKRILQALESIGYPSAMISLLNRDKKQVDAIAATGIMKPLVRVTKRPMGGGDILPIIVESGEEEYIQDSSKDARCAQDAVETAELRSQLILPLKTTQNFGGEKTGVFGTLQIADIIEPIPGTSEREIISQIIELASIALTNALLHRETQIIAHDLDVRLKALVKSSMTLGKSARIDEILNEILTIALKTVSANVGFIALREPDLNKLVFRATAGRKWRAGRLKKIYDIDDNSTRGYVVKQKRAILNPDTRVKGIPYHPDFKDIQSNCGVPIAISGKMEAALVVESRKLNAFGEEDLRLLEAFASIIGLAIAESRDFLMANTLSRVSQTLSMDVPLRERLHNVCEITCDALGSSHCSIFVMPEGSIDRIVLEATTLDELSQQIGKADYQLGEGLTGWVAGKKQALRVRGDFTLRNLSSIDPSIEWRHKYQEIDPKAPHDYLAAPLLAFPEECIGTIRCADKRGPLELFTFDDQELLVSVGKQVAQAIERDRLESARSRILAEAVHQLSGPLHTTKSNIDYLIDYLVEEEERTEILAEIQEETIRGIELMDRIALSDKLKSGNISLESKTVHLKNCINEIFGRYRNNAKERGIIFRCKCPADLTVEVDDRLLVEALSNLVENALEFTPDSTYITVFAQRVENNVEIKVFDQGPGLSPEALKRYSELYFSEPLPGNKAKGHGLGLFIAQWIIHLHSGELRAADKGGGNPGAVFTIALPQGGLDVNNNIDCG